MNLEELLGQQISSIENSKVKEAMAYSLLSGGKRVRPNLLFTVLRGYGQDEKKGIELACALEMIHTYSLIHDDLPAMDNDDLRRGKPTCHKQFDEATAILAGDGLLTYAFETAAKASIPADQLVKAISILSASAGPDGMILGQCLDIEEGDSDVDWDGLKNIHRLKTGCLLSAPCMIAAVISNQDEATVQTWKQIGTMIGLAFQVQDDVMDVTLTAEQFGKSNSDVRNNKITSVTLLGLDGAKELMHSLYTESIQKLQQLKGFEAEEIISFIEELQTRNI